VRSQGPKGSGASIPSISGAFQYFSASEAPSAHGMWYVGCPVRTLPAPSRGGNLAAARGLPGGSEAPAVRCWAPLRSVGGWLLAAALLDHGGKAGARNRLRACRALGDLLSGGSCRGVGRSCGPQDARGGRLPGKLGGGKWIADSPRRAPRRRVGRQGALRRPPISRLEVPPSGGFRRRPSRPKPM
jgi:hypothetical protein